MILQTLPYLGEFSNCNKKDVKRGKYWECSKSPALQSNNTGMCSRIERQENIRVHDSPVATLSRKRMCLNLHPYLQNGRATQRCQLRNNIGLAGERDFFMSISILCCSFEIMGLVLSLETDLCGKATLFVWIRCAQGTPEFSDSLR